MRRALEFGFKDITPLMHSGVYALCKRELVVYIGQAKFLLPRLYTHWSIYQRARKNPDLVEKGYLFISSKKWPVLSFDNVLIYPCAQKELNALEAQLIADWDPKRNIMLRKAPAVKLRVSLESLGIKTTSSKTELPARIERRV